MGRGIRLFKVLGIRISLDYTWFIVFVLVAWSLSYGYYPEHIAGIARGSYILMGIVSSLLLFTCVLIHELSHSYTANRLGLDIKEITLFIFGGIAKLTKEPEDPWTEFKIAIAGPLASAALAISFWAAKTLLVGANLIPEVSAILGFLVMINTVLLVFNMIPGLPLDGGRVLRAALWARTGDIERATRLSSQVGKAFALFLIVIGFLQIGSGNLVGGIWSVLIGVFLQQAAEGSYRQMLVKKTLAGVTVGDMMTRNVVTVADTLTLDAVIERYFFNYHFLSFPVMSGGRVIGLLTLNHVRATSRENWAATRIIDVMEPLTLENVLVPELPAMEALARMSGEGSGRFPVIKDGLLVGILTSRDIMKTLEFRSELEG
ncbi:MAG: site-2 protease family protein [Deltaproteobacteria bacterium]|nr:site-2 protease family protein [Deltaproteobacteria bacterium]